MQLFENLNSTCIIGYKIADYRKNFNNNIFNLNVNLCKQHVGSDCFCVEKQSIVNSLHICTLICIN